jgi:hypothetical protein
LDISNARNSVVVNHVRLKFYTNIFGAIIKSLLAKKGIFSMMNFRHSSTLTPSTFQPPKSNLFSNLRLFSNLQNPTILTDFHCKSRYPTMPRPDLPLPTFFLTLFNVLGFRCRQRITKYSKNMLTTSNTI